MKKILIRTKRSILKAMMNFIKPTPRSCSLFITETCNFKCEGCRRSVVEQHLSNEVNLKLVEKLLSVYPKINFFCIAGLGEPTLASEFCEITDYLKSKNKYVLVITNGTNSEKFLKLKYKPDRISISLYGNKTEDYIDYCKVDCFEEVMSNYKILKNNFPSVGFSFILSKQNYKQLEGVLELCDSIIPEFLNLHNYLVYDPESETERAKVIKKDDKEIWQYIEKVCKNRKYKITTPSPFDPDYNNFNCLSYYRNINLDGNGNIGGCLSQVPPDREYGNILECQDPFNSERMKKIRKRILSEKIAHETCKYCFRKCE